MTIRHHPDPETLMAYAGGSLDPPFALAVRAHLSLCPECRREAVMWENTGGALLEALAPAAMRADALARTLDRLDGPELTPVPKRREWPIAPGLRFRRVWRGPRSGAFLLRIAPGSSVPMHAHHGREAVCVLRGGYSDAFGRYGLGDFVAHDGLHRHEPRADEDGECLALMAYEGALLFGGLAGLVARFLL